MTGEPSVVYRSFQGYKHFQHSFIAVLHDFWSWCLCTLDKIYCRVVQVKSHWILAQYLSSFVAL